MLDISGPRGIIEGGAGDLKGVLSQASRISTVAKVDMDMPVMERTLQPLMDLS